MPLGAALAAPPSRRVPRRARAGPRARARRPARPRARSRLHPCVLLAFRKLAVLSQRTAGRPAPLSRAPCRPRGLQLAPITLNNVTSDV